MHRTFEITINDSKILDVFYLVTQASSHISRNPNAGLFKKMYCTLISIHDLSFSTEITVEPFADSFLMLHLKVKCTKQYHWEREEETDSFQGLQIRAASCANWGHREDFLIQRSVWHSSGGVTWSQRDKNALPGQICKHQLNLHGKSNCHLLWQKEPPGHIPAVPVTSVS